MSEPLHVIVLAAGEGKRMKSALPKVLLPLAGRPLLAHVLEAARGLQPSAIHVVYGHRGEQVREAFAGMRDLRWVHQPQQRGTGDAVRLALADVPDRVRVLVLYGDVPLTRVATLRQLEQAEGGFSLLTTRLADPRGYGRVLCDGNGKVRAVIEEKDANADQRAVNLVNTGILVADAKAFVDELGDASGGGLPEHGDAVAIESVGVAAQRVLPGALRGGPEIDVRARRPRGKIPLVDGRQLGLCARAFHRLLHRAQR